MTRLAGALSLFAVLVHGGVARADRSPLRVGEVEAEAPQVAQRAKSALYDELTLLALPPSAQRSAASVVSMSVVKLERSRRGESRRIECVVSATLRDARKGTLYAVLEGRARLEDGAQSPQAEQAVLRGAIHGAVAQIPRALR